MPLAPPQLKVVHGVLQASTPISREPAAVELFQNAVSPAFPNQLSRQLLPEGAPPNIPHLVLGSSSSQLVISSAVADFEVGFYGEFVEDMDRALAYVQEKMLTVLAGFGAIDSAPATIGLVASFNFPFAGEESATEHVLDTHLQSDLSDELVQDAVARLAVKVRDTYFVTLTINNYETRELEKPLVAGQPMIVRPWEGTVSQTGLELTIDINNNLESRVKQADTVVTSDGISAVIEMLKTVGTTVGPHFASTGEILMDVLEESSNKVEAT